ncbi:hypothetical protein [Bosea sp. OK403]|uniref:hypothetical protein n=1 Tax=Bosea sp. OK403 TaxID=1855286 RepID=UPI000B846801|nr:hypothetical protein [Bosea sp. OK403]
MLTASLGCAPFRPFLDAREIAIEAPNRGRIAKASSFNSPSEAARPVCDGTDCVESVWLGGPHVVSEAALRVEMLARCASGAKP